MISTTPLPPGPRDPSALQFAHWMRNPIPFLENCAARFGDTFTLHLPFLPPVVVYSDPAAIKQIFTGDPEALYAGEANRQLQSVLGENSLLVIDGERHQRQRRLMMPPFHGERMRGYGNSMRDIAGAMVKEWPARGRVLVHEEMQRITLDVILRTVFGFQPGARLDVMRARLVRFVQLGTSPLATLLLLAVPADYAGFIDRAASEPWRLGPIKLGLHRFMPWRQVTQAGRAVDELLFEELRLRRQSGRADDGHDVLSMLMQGRDEHGEPMSDQELRDEMLTLLLAGHETSATTLTWAIAHLLENPAALATARAELDRGVGDRPLQSEELGRLEYIDAVIKETMRLTPIVPVVGRRLKRPLTIGGRDLPIGTAVVPCIYLTHHRADLWPDPERFLPERFVGTKPDPYHFFPFGGGARRCLGQAFALYEMKIVLAEVLRSVDLERGGSEPVRVIRRGVTLAPAGGVPVTVRARRPQSKVTA